MSVAGFADLEHFGMNTVMTHRAYGNRADDALQAVREEALRLEGLLSRFLSESDVSRINRAAGKGTAPVSEETYAVLSRAARFSELSRGRFDVTIGPLAALWGKAREAAAPPEDERIREALALVDHTGLALDDDKRMAGLRQSGQIIDLGGIGKGYAGDRFLEIFREHGITSAFTNIGGNVAALGVRPDGSPWRVGIRHPRKDGELIGAVSVADRAVVTSGDYQRYFVDGGGARYHHILDPATGYPADTGLLSVTVIAAGSMDADGLSTMLFVAGIEKGLPLLRQFPGAEAILVAKNLQVHITAGLKGNFQAADGINTDTVK